MGRAKDRPAKCLLLALRGGYEQSVWEHLAGNLSAPFEIGEYRQIAVKAIDERGNELMVVRNLSEAK